MVGQRPSRNNTSKVFQDDGGKAKILSFLLASRGLGKEDDLRKLDPSRLDKLVPALNELVRIAKTCAEIGLSKKDLDILASMQLIEESRKEYVRKAGEDRYLELFQEASSAHNLFLEAFQDAFPKIIQRPKVGPSDDWLIPISEGSGFLDCLRPIFENNIRSLL